MIVAELYIAVLLVCSAEGGACTAHKAKVALPLETCLGAATIVNARSPVLTVNGVRHRVYAACLDARYKHIFDRKT